MVDVRRTHTPDRRADSAVLGHGPHGQAPHDQRMNAARASATIGATTRVSTSPDLNSVPPTVNVMWTGSGNDLKSSFGRMNGSTVNRYSTWQIPIVATITRTRGRFKSRRRTSSDTRRPPPPGRSR